MNSDRVKRFVARHRLPFAIFLVIVIALLMTAISMSLYISSGTSSLDLSRPGYKQVREQVVVQSSESFDSNGPMDQTTVTTFKKMFDSQKKSLENLGDFNDTSLDDTSLQF